MLPRLISNSWAQNISLLQPSEYSRLEVYTTALVLLMAVFSFPSCALLWIPSPLLHPYFKHGCSGFSFRTFTLGPIPACSSRWLHALAPIPPLFPE